MKLVSTKFTNLVPVEQFNHKPMGMYDGDHHHTLPYSANGNIRTTGRLKLIVCFASARAFNFLASATGWVSVA